MGQAARPTSLFSWNMEAPDLGTAQAYRYELELDGILLTNQLLSTCTGTPPLYSCTSPIPQMAPGNHLVRIRAVDVTGGEPVWSDWSDPLAFNMRATPAKPINLVIIR